MVYLLSNITYVPKLFHIHDNKIHVTKEHTWCLVNKNAMFHLLSYQKNYRPKPLKYKQKKKFNIGPSLNCTILFYTHTIELSEVKIY